jgi:parvulin-like peptidyl-prolyl isomerase
MSEHDKKKDGQKLPLAAASKTIALGALSVIVLAVVIGLVVVWLGIYKWGWNNQVTNVAVRSLDLPMARVNGEAVAYSDYLDDLDTLKRFFDNQVAEGMPGDSVPTVEEMKENAFNKLVYGAVLQQEADSLGVAVTDEDIENEYATLVAQSGGEEEVKAELQLLYGWDPDTFKQKVLVPYLLQTKIAEALRDDESFNAGQVGLAEEILGRAQDGEDFSKLAEEYSEDPGSAPAGGDLGWFERGMMVQAFEDAAFSLQPGEISEIVETQFGYHIILVDEVEEEDGETVRVKARHILLGLSDVNTYLQEKEDTADVEMLIEI